VDPGEVLRALAGVVADLQDRVADELRRDHLLRPAASPTRSPGPHNRRLAESGSRESTTPPVARPHPQCDGPSTPNWMFCESEHWLPSAILGAPESAIPRSGLPEVWLRCVIDPGL
jgi:hypothetical protein